VNSVKKKKKKKKKRGRKRKVTWHEGGLTE
jgi:hypothetical protein